MRLYHFPLRYHPVILSLCLVPFIIALSLYVIFIYKEPVSMLIKGIFLGQNGSGQTIFWKLWLQTPASFLSHRGHVLPRLSRLEPLLVRYSFQLILLWFHKNKICLEQDLFNVQFHTKCAVLEKFAQFSRKQIQFTISLFSNPRVQESKQQ